MLSKIFQKEEYVDIDDIKILRSSRHFNQVTIEDENKKNTYIFLESFFNGYAFVFILNVDKSAYTKIKDIMSLIKDKERQNKIKYSKRYFFVVDVPENLTVSQQDIKIEISLIKESFGYVAGYNDIYQCYLYGNYPYNQKVFCENLYDLPLVFRKFIEINQDKPENLLKFFHKEAF